MVISIWIESLPWTFSIGWRLWFPLRRPNQIDEKQNIIYLFFQMLMNPTKAKVLSATSENIDRNTNTRMELCTNRKAEPNEIENKN